jgi:hypothetical protein
MSALSVKEIPALVMMLHIAMPAPIDAELNPDDKS